MRMTTLLSVTTAALVWASPALAQINFGTLEPYRGNQRCLVEDCTGARSLDIAPAQPDPAQLEFNARVQRAQAAHRAGNLQEAIRLVLEALALREDASLRSWLAHAQAADAINRANEAFDRGDIQGAIELYRQGMRHPDFNTRARREFLGDLEDRARRQSELAARREQERRNAPEAMRLNNEGVELLRTYQPEQALTRFRRALELLPDDRQIRANVLLAQANLSFRNGDIDGTITHIENAIAWDPENRAAVELLQRARSYREEQRTRMLAALDAARERLASPGPSVVDARVSSLAAQLQAQVPELATSPAAEPIRGGFQAVINRDWPLALAMWQTALQRDPNNQALLRSVELARWMVDRRRVAVGESARLRREAAEALRQEDIRRVRAFFEGATFSEMWWQHMLEMMGIQPASPPASPPPKGPLSGFNTSLARELMVEAMVEWRQGNVGQANEILRRMYRTVLGTDGPSPPGHRPPGASGLDFITR